jgi:hypothetical protein
MSQPDVFKIAKQMFGAIEVPDDGLDLEMNERLHCIATLLRKTDSKGRVAFTETEIESCIIGLRGFKGDHPRIDEMLLRLEAALPKALTWQKLAKRKT